MSNVLSKISNLFWFITNNETDEYCSVFVEFKFVSEEKKSEFIKLLKGNDGLKVTRQFNGCLNIHCHNNLDDNTSLVLIQQWENRKDHEDYLAMRKNTGLLDKLNTEFLKEQLSPVYMNYVSDL